MTKNCIYCKTDVSEESVIDFCKRCGVSVFGLKMFDTIVHNMESARDNGDLCHNRTAEPMKPPTGETIDEIIAR